MLFLAVLFAVVNAVCTSIVLVTTPPRRSFARAFAFLFPLLSTLALTFWPQPPGLARPRMAVFFAYGVVVAITWAPGALFAFFGARREPSARMAFAAASIIISTALGAAFPLTTLMVMGGVFHDWL